jgi:Tfp pilus assembly protein PilF
MRILFAFALFSGISVAQTVSAAQLANKVPPRAIREYRESIKAVDANDIEKAVEHTQHALKMDPRNPAAWVNLALLHLNAGRPSAAESAARRATELAPDNRRAHLILGWTLAVSHVYSAESLASLRKAAREFPEARLAAADVLLHQGDMDGSRKEVETYLRSGETEYREVAASWLRLLTFE